VSETQNVVRMNISVPRELKARMDAATAYRLPGSVNWSAVASAAFEAKLLELASNKEVRGLKDVIARLRAADELDRNENYRAGRVAGERWAEQKATAQQLRNLRRCVDESSGRLLAGFESVASDAASETGPGVGWHVYFGTLGRGVARTWPEVQAVSAEADTFWRGVLGDESYRIESVPFGQGFVDGALGVWAKVERQVEAKE
jgi:hypothetical protein